MLVNRITLKWIILIGALAWSVSGPQGRQPLHRVPGSMKRELESEQKDEGALGRLY